MILAGQVALVTGSAAGIGKACAIALAEAGAHVVSVDINGPGAEQTADIDRMVQAAMAEFGRIDILVNNAGVTRRVGIMDITEADWDRIHRVNAKGVFFCLQRVAREMIAQRSGRIINIASIAGKGYVGSSNVAYAASKGAVISLTRLGALQLAEHNINVNAICPGITRSALMDSILKVNAEKAGVSLEEMERQRDETIPLRRANDPEDIAAMAVFLASPGARNITAQTYNVDGGLIPD